MVYNENSSHVWFLTGIFHAFDLIGVRQYHSTEYRGYALDLANAALKREDDGSVLASTISEWFEKQSRWGFMPAVPKFKELCAALADAL